MTFTMTGKMHSSKPGRYRRQNLQVEESLCHFKIQSKHSITGVVSRAAWKERRLVRWAGAGPHRARQAGVRCWDSILRTRWEAIKSNLRFYVLSRKRYY